MNIDRINETFNKFSESDIRTILINGPWGIGKSYAIEKYSKEKNWIKVSTFGKYNGLRNSDTNYLIDNESDILKSRDERILLSCQEREEISVQNSKLKLS